MATPEFLIGNHASGSFEGHAQVSPVSAAMGCGASATGGKDDRMWHEQEFCQQSVHSVRPEDSGSGSGKKSTTGF